MPEDKEQELPPYRKLELRPTAIPWPIGAQAGIHGVIQQSHEEEGRDGERVLVVDRLRVMAVNIVGYNTVNVQPEEFYLEYHAGPDGSTKLNAVGKLKEEDLARILPAIWERIDKVDNPQGRRVSLAPCVNPDAARCYRGQRGLRVSVLIVRWTPRNTP